MLARVTAFLVLIVILAACGGGSTTSQSPSTSAAPSAQGTPPVVTGDAIDSETVGAAVAALQAMESWTFDVSTITMGLETGVRTTITGTERNAPQKAVKASHVPVIGDPPFQYIRIEDDIWFDTGTGTFTQVEAAEAENLIDQYEPYYLTGLAQSAVDNDFQFEPVGTEVINTIEAMHYRLSEEDLEQITETTELSPDQWGGDVWIATDGGYLVQLAWGPQTPADALLTTGFIYTVTDVDCECPIEPPA
ncbi:MAG TPA: hypothetical protein VEX62_03755 [Candidatus Limnocylindrales bacterium]|nr:hypothetical protein [Candidatus Limnocylindrales bacterium]